MNVNPICCICLAGKNPKACRHYWIRCLKKGRIKKMRRLNDAAYQIQDQIAILTALIAEATQATARLHQMAA